MLEAFVALPAMRRPESGGEGNGMRMFHPVRIGSFEAGVTFAPELSVAELVASVTLDLLVNGSPLAKGEVTLRRTDPNAMLVGRSAPSGHWGPMLATAGEWTLTVGQPGSWQWRLPGSLWLAAGEQRHQTLQIEVAPGTLRFVDRDGTPLAHRAIHVALDGEPFAFLVAETDDEGRLALTLAPASLRARAQRLRPARRVDRGWPGGERRAALSARSRQVASLAILRPCSTAPTRCSSSTTTCGPACASRVRWRRWRWHRTGACGS